MEAARNKQLKEFVVDKGIIESFRYRCQDRSSKFGYSVVKKAIEQEVAEEGE